MRDEGLREGMREGMREGKEETIELVASAYEEGLTPPIIATITKLPIEKVIQIIEKHKSQFKNGSK